MIKRRPRSKPDLTFAPVVIGDVHLMKERAGYVITTKCGNIVDTHPRNRTAVKTTAWNSEITCRGCLNPGP